MIKKIFISTLVTLSLVGCANFPREQYAADDIVSASYYLADNLYNNLPQSVRSSNSIMITSLANIDDLGKSSTQGRMLAEHVASRLVQSGLRITDVRLMSDTLLIKEKDGEFALSRNTEKLNKKIDSEYIITGTYAKITSSRYSVSVHLIRTADGVCVSSSDVLVDRF